MFLGNDLLAWLILALGGALFAYVQFRGHSSIDATVVQLAQANSGGAVEAHTGPNHTVYHSAAPLPTASTPRADGRPTLVWFSATTCEYCERMEPFANSVAHTFVDRLAFVEKGIDTGGSSDAAHFAVRGTPTFVLLDARGRAVAQFGFQATPESFAASIERALSRLTS